MRRIALMVAGLALCAGPVCAQETQETEPNAPIENEEAVQATEDDERVFTDRIVVTASRQEQASATTPAPISVIEGEEIARRQPEKLADLFKDLPGVEVSGEGPFRGLPVIRGLSSNRVLILVDGQRLNNARESTLFAGIQPGLVDLAQVERIEVLRGPASVQYGSDAMGGVINIITKKPDLGADEFEIHGSASFEYGSAADSNRTQAEVRGSGDGWAFNLSGGIETIDDYRAPDEAADKPYYAPYVKEDGTVPNSGLEQESFQGGVRFLTGNQGVLRAGVEVVRTSDVGFPGFDPADGIDISFPRFDRDKLSVGWDSGPLGFLENLTLQGYGQQVVKESVRNFNFGSFFQNSFTESTIDSWGLNAQGVTTVGIHRLTFGVDYYRDDVSDEALTETPFGESDTVTVPDSYQTGFGLYVQDEIQATDRLRLLLGVRADSFEFASEDDPRYDGEPFDVSDDDISGNVGVVYSLTPNVQLTGLVGRGFRAPNIQERAFSGAVSEPGFLLIQNPDLTSERSLNYEAGFKVRYDRYFGGLTLFYNEIEDLITFVELGPDPTSGLILLQYDNIDEATIQGIELELETIVDRHWTVFTTASYTRGDNDLTDEPLDFIPPWKVALGVRYERPDWWVELRGRLVGEQTRVPGFEDISDPDETQQPVGDFAVADVRGGFTLDWGLSVKATLANITNELYSEPFNIRPEPARNLRISLGYAF
jgi:hemoglobin/transferrin/lactoferrin receptor protein